jgi:hypothetical protein
MHAFTQLDDCRIEQNPTAWSTLAAILESPSDDVSLIAHSIIINLFTILIATIESCIAFKDAGRRLACC